MCSRVSHLHNFLSNYGVTFIFQTNLNFMRNHNFMWPVAVSQSVAFSYLVKAKVTLVSWHGGGDDKGHLQFLQWGWESTTVVDHNGLWFHWLFTLALAGGTLHVAALSLTMNKWNPCFGVLGCDLRNYVSTFQTIVQLSYFFFCLRSSMLKSTLRVDTLTISFKMGTLMRSIDN